MVTDRRDVHPEKADGAMWIIMRIMIMMMIIIIMLLSNNCLGDDHNHVHNVPIYVILLSITTLD